MALSGKATVEGWRPRLETERGNHGERQQWSWLKQTLVYVPLCLPLCAHTPHVKPSDACTAALTCQSQPGGRGSSLLQSTPPSTTHPPLAVHVGESINEDMQEGSWSLRGTCRVWTKKKKFWKLYVQAELESRGSEVDVFEAVKTDWAGDVSVGGAEEKEGTRMSEQCRSEMRMAHCCCVLVGGGHSRKKVRQSIPNWALCISPYLPKILQFCGQLVS